MSDSFVSSNAEPRMAACVQSRIVDGAQSKKISIVSALAFFEPPADFANYLVSPFTGWNAIFLLEI